MVAILQPMPTPSFTVLTASDRSVADAIGCVAWNGQYELVAVVTSANAVIVYHYLWRAVWQWAQCEKKVNSQLRANSPADHMHSLVAVRPLPVRRL